MVLTARHFLLVAFALVLSTAASAQRAATTDALERLGEVLQPAIEDGSLQGISPVIVVGARPAFEATQAWFPTAAVVALADAFGRANLRACEACMQPRVNSQDGRLEYSSVAISLEEIIAIDTNTRGASAPARAAVWVDETDAGVAIRIVSLSTGQILFAQNLDGALREVKRTAQTFNFADDVQRRLRGESLTHVFIDVALFPGQHVSMDIVDQFGDRNLDMAGLTLSAFDPIVGIGGCYHRVIPEAWNLSIGGQLLASIPTAAGNAFGISGQVLDPLVTAVLVVRWPIPQTSYAVLGTASTNGQFGLGITLMNFSFLPVLP